jgi:23S rRNA (guanosine2251-2'-O)-methyltransferase
VKREREPRVVFGFHAVLARLRADPSSVLELFVDETRHDARIRDVAAQAERAGVKVMKVPTKRLDGFYGGGRHQGVVARVAIKTPSHSLDEILEQVQGPPLLLLLDEATPYIMVTNLARTIDELKEREIWVVGTDERAEQSIYQANLPEAIAWVLGAEGEGMRRLTREKCDLLVRIPMAGAVGSLNVSVAAGICLFDSARRRLKVSLE